MPVQSEPNRLGDWLKFEEDNLYSRDEVTIASGQNLATGTVIGVITASGKATQLAPGGERRLGNGRRRASPQCRC